uniref:MULTIHEME_CYTC domain-containing protein n=1 Tax=Steinernema glaseri TaxID=37863 RepID=A0A1I7ZS86_9BILA
MEEPVFSMRPRLRLSLPCRCKSEPPSLLHTLLESEQDVENGYTLLITEDAETKKSNTRSLAEPDSTTTTDHLPADETSDDEGYYASTSENDEKQNHGNLQMRNDQQESPKQQKNAELRVCAVCHRANTVFDPEKEKDCLYCHEEALFYVIC